MKIRRFFNVFVAVAITAMLLGVPLTAFADEPGPIAVAFIAKNRVVGFHWPADVQVILTIDDPDNGPGVDYTEPQTSVSYGVDPWETKVDFYLSGFTLEPEQVITLTDGNTIKEHIVTNLTFGGGNSVTDTVWGTADPGAVIEVIHLTDRSIFRRVTADQNGGWLADFAVAGDEPGEEKLYDFLSGDILMILQDDDDGDHTQVDWQVLTPDITAAPSNDWISGEEWPIDATVTIEIDDLGTTQNPDFSTSQIATEEGWRPDQIGGSFHYWSEYDFSPGDVVTLSDGIITKSLVVSDVQITTIDIDNDVIAGFTDPDRDMWVFVHGENGTMKKIQSDSSGYWSADFADAYNIRVGTEGSLKVFDDDEDMTHADWWVPINTEVVQFEGNGHSYQAIDMALSWQEARDYCAALDGHLVTIDSLAENQFVFDLLPWSWLGATDEVSEGTWLWVTGEPWNYENWADGEPNNCCPPENCGGTGCTPEHYLTFWGDPYVGKWNDVPDGYNNFVCEWDVLGIEIDIKPGSDPNSINLDSLGVIPVAVLTMDDFDAGTLDPVTVVFAGASPLRWSLQDVDCDGDMDLVFHFKTQELQLDTYSTEAWLTGATFDEISVEGVDSVNIVPAK